MNAKTRKTRRPLTDEEKAARKAKRAATVAYMEQVTEEFDIDEHGKGMLRAFDSLCAHYSEGNALLILAQAADQGLKVKSLEDVGAFGTWIAKGRSPLTGSHASIFVWAPAFDSSQADKVEEVPASATPDKKSTRKFWKLAPLFHISQTEVIKPKSDESK